MTHYRITVENTGDVFDCGTDKNVLGAMLSLGHRGIPAGCRGGGCGVCKVKVTRGDYRCRKMSRAHVSVEDERAGVALACQLIPQSKLSLRVLGPMQKNMLRSKNRAVADYWKSVRSGEA